MDDNNHNDGSKVDIERLNNTREIQHNESKMHNPDLSVLSEKQISTT